MFYLLSIISLLFVEMTPVSASPKARLQVDIHNVNSQNGAVFVALFKPGREFPEGKPVEGKKIDASASSLQITFSVEPGNYALALFHDMNSNGKMDKNMLGIPKEPYGFSNDFRPRFSVPRFSDCQFSVGEGGKTVRVNLQSF
ncbi:DUF2141 domain-containing protein [Spirosoma spitsbergense]|jgi:uncharacterized protein (DUF2141 family)|uniref:DUF2141 domain-containing protein n=1 Tax=Spirosoma spitsbergense TaxID=431554 RepID=UPI00038268F6|nr:DUF2141 domain-containing protein [Spirosoma spitsbergense]